MQPEPRVALCHYWLVSSRGGEAVLEALLDIYPQADIYTHVLDPAAISPRLVARVKGCSFVNRLPGASRYYPLYLPLMPLALKFFDLSGYDLVISSESGPAKGVTVAPGATHLCYCHSPMRYLWDQADTYLKGMGRLKSLFFRCLLPLLRRWDVASSRMPDRIIANSSFVRQRIRRYWGRDADVIPPPVETGRFSISEKKGDYYLALGQLVAYKRPDLLVEAFNDSGRRLLVAGEGEMATALRSQARDNVTFLGRVSDDQAVELLQGCRALVFPGIEDFGIVPLEAMACGRPVVAYGKGGVLDTVVDGVTGLYYHEDSAGSLNRALQRFEQTEGQFDPRTIAAHAQNFSRRRFTSEFASYAATVMAQTAGTRESTLEDLTL